jgi:mitotic spindle assembly checkpoint protein MAD2
LQQFAATQQQQKGKITLKGSTDIVSEFFGYGIQSILYQRGIYGEDEFGRVTKYGLPMWVTKNDELKKYLANVLNQVTSKIEETESRHLFF